MIALPECCHFTALPLRGAGAVVVTGLEIDPGIDYAAWLGIGRKINRFAGSLMFIVGDWLAYGQRHYQQSQWSDRVPTDLYRLIAKETGLAESTLRNAKYVCTHLPAALRNEKLTFNHALEIVSKAKEADYGQWIEKVTTGELTVKELRESLKKSRAIHPPEPEDSGHASLLERVRQLKRDLFAERKTLTNSMRTALKKELLAILQEL